jgi:hypothetical protein
MLYNTVESGVKSVPYLNQVTTSVNAQRIVVTLIEMRLLVATA